MTQSKFYLRLEEEENKLRDELIENGLSFSLADKLSCHYMTRAFAAGMDRQRELSIHYTLREAE